MLVCLNKFVMYVAFLACVCEGGPVLVLCWGEVVCFCLCAVFLLVLMGKELLCSMLWMVFSSRLYSSSCSWYLFSLWYRNLTAAYLCYGGWFEVYGMIVSINVGFLKIKILTYCALCMVVSRKLIVLLCSNSALNMRFGCRALKSVRMDCMYK
jgi:hypothetical protein